MDPTELISTVTQIIQRPNGAQVKIVATDFGGPFGRNVGIDVFRRDDESQPWKLCSDRPHPDWRTMSVDEYIKRGRSEQMQAASFGELHRVSSLIGKTKAQARAMGAEVR